MFTGIIEEVGHIARVDDLGGGIRLTISAKMVPELRVDQSVAVNGVCQTVTGFEDASFQVTAIEETLRKTTLGNLVPGEPVNLERAMLPTSRLDGHIVQGHVDATGVITAVEMLETSRLYSVAFDRAFAPYIIPVGSIAIDGISLTVARLEENALRVAIIPHTLANTNVPLWKEGRAVNLEFDLVGKYVTRWLQITGHQSSPGLPGRS